jgi:carbon storage regulator
MLVLSRRVGEDLVITGSIRIRVLGCRGNRVRLGIEAPPTVLVDRQEVHARRQEFASPADQRASARAEE